MYRAEALILVDPQKVPEKFVTSTVTEDLQDRLATISQEILSTTRLRKIIEDLNLYPDKRKTLAPEEIVELMRKDIEVRVEKSRAFRIGYQGRDPKLAAEVVNQITDLYIAQNLKSRETQAEGTTEFIDHQLQEAKKRLDETEGAVSQYKVRHTGELPEQESSLSGALSRLQMELQGNQESTNRARQDRLALESALNSAESAEAALQQSARGAVAQAGRRQSGAAVVPRGETRVQRPSEILEAELAVMRQHYTEDHPDVRRAKQRIAAQRRGEEREFRQQAQAPAAAQAAAAAQADGEKEPAVSPAPVMDPATAVELIRVRERISTLRSQLSGLDRAAAEHAAERQRILDSISSYQHRIEQLPFREQEMAAMRRDYEISKGNYGSLLEKKIAAEMSSDLERRQKAEKFRTLDSARAPDKPFKPNRKALYLLCIAAGLGLGVVAAVGMELRSGVLLGEWELPKGTLVIGTIPNIEAQLPPAGASTEVQGGRVALAGTGA